MGLRASFAIATGILMLTTTPAWPQTPAPIDYPGAVDTRPAGINPRGEISGTYVSSNGSTHHGFLLNQNGFTSIDVPGAVQTNASKISPHGDIVGFYNLPGATSRGFLLRQGIFYHVYFPGSFLTT